MTPTVLAGLRVQGRARLQGLEGLTREGAREAAEAELRRRAYQEARPPLLLRALTALLDLLERVLDAVPGVSGGRAGVALLALLLVGVVGVVTARLGPLQRGRAGTGAVDSGTRLSAAGHRAKAELAAEQERWADAVRERLRAVVRELEDRGVLDPSPGRTAGEVARDAGAAAPSLADDLRRAAAVFDEVWYGGRTADAPSYAVVVALDTRVSGTPVGR